MKNNNNKVIKKVSRLNMFKKKKLVTSKVFSIGNYLLSNVNKTPLSIAIKKILKLSFSRATGLTLRVRIVLKLWSMILKLNKNHGSLFTIKWLKACYVALQKSLAGDNLSSLRDLEKDLPLPRLINGLPTIIGPRDRALIKRNHKPVIIFWSSIFSVYRVLKAPYTLSVSTIISQFTGNFNSLLSYCKIAETKNVFMCLPNYDLWKSHVRLAPRNLLISRAASATNKESWNGLLSDIALIFCTDKFISIRENIFQYLKLLKENRYNTTQFYSRIKGAIDLFHLSEQTIISLKTKKSWGFELGQLAFKEEAAGKLRVFAIVDSLTQSVLTPLHDSLFDLLRIIPNDGTFDQEASIRRSQEKAVKYGCAYSFDLSAATDRLPVLLSASILDSLLIRGLGKVWKDLLVDRNYAIPSHKYETSYDKEFVRYQVGQPMGAKSSWAMLAITHHWILQFSSPLFILNKWEDKYEILGDDLVVFDSELAQRYLEVTKELGVTINLSKSIVSPNLPVFEFAKRTCIGEMNVSPIAFSQLLSSSLGERVGTFFNLVERGIITTCSTILTSISRDGSSLASYKNKMVITPVLAILGALCKQHKIPHRWLFESLVDPHNDEFDFSNDSLRIPINDSCKLIQRVVTTNSLPDSYPFSNEDVRSEMYSDYEPEFGNVIANTALAKAKALQADYDNLIRSQASKLVSNWESLTGLQKAQLIGWFEDILIGEDYEDLDDVIESIIEDDCFYYRHNLTIDHASKLLDKVERLEFKFKITSKERTLFNDDQSSVLLMLNKVTKGVKSHYY